MPFLKADIRAIEQNKMRFAKMLVLIDLLSPLKEMLWLGLFKQSLEFGEIPSFFFDCKSIEHPKPHCSKATNVDHVVEMDVDTEKEKVIMSMAMETPITVAYRPEQQWQEVKIDVKESCWSNHGKKWNLDKEESTRKFQFAFV